MANGPSSSSAGWNTAPPQTVQSSTGSSPSSSSCAAASGLAPIVRHSPSRVSIFIISAGPLHSGGVGARRGLRAGRSRGEGTEIGSVCGISVAFDLCVVATCSGFTRVASIALHADTGDTARYDTELNKVKEMQEMQESPRLREQLQALAARVQP